MSVEEAVDIDEPFNFVVAEVLMAARLKGQAVGLDGGDVARPLSPRADSMRAIELLGLQQESVLREIDHWLAVLVSCPG